MKQWMPLLGNFIEDNEKIIFQGMVQQPFGRQAMNLPVQNAPDGMVLFEDAISNGLIEAYVKFENFDKGDHAQIVFNYQNDQYFMSAGVTNTQPKYIFDLINGQQSSRIYATGFVEELPVSEFHIRVQIIGSFLELRINNIKVLASAIPFKLNQTQVGMWVRSKGKVIISNFNTNEKRPEAFIVSQFGGDYDTLYNEVIQPVCKELGYEPIRGDEIASCTLILNDIITSICNAAVIIADITPDNPNVFYEIGYAHALAKPTILLCEKEIRDKIPFDVSGFRTIFYDNSIGGKRKIEEKLKIHLQNINQ